MSGQPVSTSIPRKLVVQVLLLVSLLGILAAWQQPDGRLHIWFFDTAGDAALIRTPAGLYVLIDGGADPAALTAQLGRRLPYWRRDLDAVILTRSGNRHLPGQVAVLTRYRTNIALAAKQLYATATLAEWSRLLAAERTPIRRMHHGEQATFDRVVFRVFHTDADQAGGIAVLLQYGATRVLFAHGVAEDARLSDEMAGKPVDLLVYPWEYPPPADLIVLHPDAMVLSDGISTERPARLTFFERSFGRIALYHERIHGTIEWVSDGRYTWISTERKVG